MAQVVGKHPSSDDSRIEPKHMDNFEKALKHALKHWSSGGSMTVEFQASITANPGGIREYRVVLKG
jgi:hypothetical protein